MAGVAFCGARCCYYFLPFVALLLCLRFAQPSQAIEVPYVRAMRHAWLHRSCHFAFGQFVLGRGVEVNMAGDADGLHGRPHDVRVCFQVRGGGYGEEKVPLAVIVPDPSPELSPTHAPPPLSGAGDDDDDMRPRLPTERWRRGRGEERSSGGGGGGHRPHAAATAPAPEPMVSSGPAPASAAPDPAAMSSTAFIRSSPAVPVPRGVTDTATILPMSYAPGDKRQQLSKQQQSLIF
ncbi:hypothetical protein ABZP36_032605 [Zizania latifolia]